MDKTIIYSKTAKGMNELKNGAKKMPRDELRILTLINGTASVGELHALLDSSTAANLAKTLDSLSSLGMIRVFSNKMPGEIRTSTARDLQQPLDMTPDGMIKFTPVIPTIEVTELVPQEAVQLWAEARRGANILQTKGFYTHGENTVAANTEARKETLKAMVVEDDETLSLLLEKLLTHKNFEVQTANDISSALTFLNQLAAADSNAIPKLVLLDVILPGLPGKDGFHVLEYIRHNPALQHIAVIMITSQVTDEYVMRGLNAGADGYIFKPFKWQTLYECIQSVTGR